MKVFVIAFISCFAGALVGVAVLLTGDEPFSLADLFGFTTLTFFPSLLLCALLYAPVLSRLRRSRKGCRPAALFPLVSGLVLNIPVALLLLMATSSGHLFSGAEEVFTIASAFITAGILFGIGFVWNCRRRAGDGIAPH